MGILYLILTKIRYKVHERGGEMAHSQTMGTLDGNIGVAVRIIAADIQFISPPRILVISAVGQITATAPQYGNRI